MTWRMLLNTFLNLRPLDEEWIAEKKESRILPFDVMIRLNEMGFWQMGF